MKIFLLCMVLAGCDVGVNADFDGETIHTESFQVFIGVVDGVETAFRYDPFGLNDYSCVLDLTYETSTGAAILNTDTTQVACNTDLLVRSDAQATTIPLYGN